MPAIAATAYDHEYRPLIATLQRLKQAILAEIARENGAEAELEFGNGGFTYMVVNCDSQTQHTILSRLYNAGCTDLHVYTTDKTDKSVWEFSFGNAFRYVDKDEFKS